MTTIPASQLVAVNPNVLSVGGNALTLNGVLLSNNPRIPLGEVLSFPNDGKSVSDYFGPGAVETALAANYFAGYDNSPQKPNTILFVRPTLCSQPAFLQGGVVGQLTLAQLQAISGTLTATIDGYAVSASGVNLSAASSFSAAATIIQNALNATPAEPASVTGSIAAGSASVTGSISGNVLNVTAVGSGTLKPGAAISGTGVTANTVITNQLSGTTGGIGTYTVNNAQGVGSTTIAATYGTMTITAVGSGTLAVGQTVTGSGVTADTVITALGSGTGGTGTYIVNKTQTASSTSITAQATPVTVVYDSVSEGFVVTSGIVGAASSMSYFAGSIAAALFLTQATGAVLSQGADGTTPATFMSALVGISQNWASFMTVFDPDGGQGNAQKISLAAWNDTQNRRFAYIAWDTDITPTLSTDATSSFGNQCAALGYDGVCPIYDANNGPNIAAFICGTAASIDFDQVNGRVTFAYRTQAGLVAGVTSQTVAANLLANSYNFLGAYATASQQFVMFQNGSVTGVFAWLDSYMNEIQLNNSLQLALMSLLQNAGSVPYNKAGYDLIKTACADPINAALNFGSIRAGVTLSPLQASQLNAAAGVNVSDTVQNAGWYLQVLDASTLVRQARTSPPISFWYQDGESVQQIVLNSVLVQ